MYGNSDIVTPHQNTSHTAVYGNSDIVTPHQNTSHTVVFLMQPWRTHWCLNLKHNFQQHATLIKLNWIPKFQILMIILKNTPWFLRWPEVRYEEKEWHKYSPQYNSIGTSGASRGQCIEFLPHSCVCSEYRHACMRTSRGKPQGDHETVSDGQIFCTHEQTNPIREQLFCLESYSSTHHIFSYTRRELAKQVGKDNIFFHPFPPCATPNVTD